MLFSSSSRPATVAELLGKKKYGQALELLKEQLSKRPGDTGLRMQAADVLVLDGRIDNATRILETVADDFATQGFAAKAIAVLKKIQKLEPGRSDIEKKLVDLLKSDAPPPRRTLSEPAVNFKQLKPWDVEYNSIGNTQAPVQHAAPPVAMNAGADSGFGMLGGDEDQELDLGDMVPEVRTMGGTVRVPEVASRPAPSAPPADLSALSASLSEYAPAAAPPAPPFMSALETGATVEQVVALVTDGGTTTQIDIHDFEQQSFLETDDEGEPQKRVLSPLFDDFSPEELLEVIRGLQLLTFEAGDIIVTEGQPGDSLFVLTTGCVKAFIRNKEGGSTQVRQLNEGDFFGEISILTGKARSATITAAAECELLVLDRTTLDSITETKPRVRTVLQEFHDQRAHSAAEAEIRGIDAGSSAIARAAGLTDEPGGETTEHVTIVIDDDESGQETTAASTSTVNNLRKLAIESSRSKNWADAVHAWTQYTALRPDDIEAVNVLGILYGKLGRWKEAAQAFERSIELNAKDATTYFNLGITYAQIDQLPQAIQSYKHALELDPAYDKARQSLESAVARLKRRSDGVA